MSVRIIALPALLVLFALLGCASSAANGEAREGRIQYLNAGTNLPSGLPFSEAVKVGDVLYLSGQIGSIPGEARLVPGGIGPETRQTMVNIRTTLERHGYTMDDLVKCTVMLADMAEWAAFNTEYRTFFPNHFPARSAFGASGLAYDARVEVECIGAK